MVRCFQCWCELEPGAAFCPHCGIQQQRDPERAPGRLLDAQLTETVPEAETVVETPRRPAPPADPLIGRSILGQFVLREKLASGGMGDVYIAEQPTMGRKAAVKVLHPIIARDQKTARRFEVEARAASVLNHPHIVTIYNFGQMEDGELFLAMEHCKGTTLQEVLRAGALEPGRAVRIALQIAEALVEAHRHQIVHRDLKPGNIMLTEVGGQRDYVKVLDFGVARIAGQRLTDRHAVVGTPRYMSPEQCQDGPIDGRADIYAVGVMLFEMLTGEPPFSSDRLTGYVEQHVGEPPDLSRLQRVAGVDPALVQVVQQALEKDPAQRFASAGQLAVALQRARRVPQPARTATRPRRADRRWRWVALAMGSLFAVSLASFFGPWRGEDADYSGAKHRAHKKRARKRVALASDSTLPGPRDSGATADKDVAVRAAAPRPKPRPFPRWRRRDSGVTGTAKEEPLPPSAPPSGDPATESTVRALEAQWQRLLRTERIQPSSIEQMKRGYAALARLVTGKRLAHAREAFLRAAVGSLASPRSHFSPHERRPIAELKQIILTMEMKRNIPLASRRAVIAGFVESAERGNPKDRDFYLRTVLLYYIKSNARDPKGVLQRGPPRRSPRRSAAADEKL